MLCGVCMLAYLACSLRRHYSMYKVFEFISGIVAGVGIGLGVALIIIPIFVLLLC